MAAPRQAVKTQAKATTKHKRSLSGELAETVSLLAAAYAERQSTTASISDRKSEFESVLKNACKEEDLKMLQDVATNQATKSAVERLRACADIVGKHFTALSAAEEKLFRAEWADGPKIDLKKLKSMTSARFLLQT